VTPAQIVKALDRYIAELPKGGRGAIGVRPSKFDTSQINPTSPEALAHLHWMALEAKKFATEKPAKAMRWLCFIQGVLWRDGDWSIDEFKDDNRGED
jgi:hypothetical protein